VLVLGAGARCTRTPQQHRTQHPALSTSTQY
jgi:hypothetical protein